MAVPGSPTVRRRRLAAELREIRERTGKSGDVVAAALRWSPSKISRYELARTGLKPDQVAQLLDYYKVTDPTRAFLLSLAEDASHKGWWEDYGDTLSADYRQYVGLEDEASSVSAWHAHVVPGLLQTEEYARNVIGSYGQVEPVSPVTAERMVRVRMLRQQLLDRVHDLHLSVVLDESVLWRAIGGDDVMRAQMQRLARDAARPNVTLRVLPLSAGRRLVTESFVILRFGTDGDPSLQDIVCTEQLRAGFSVEDEKETYLHRLAFQAIADAALDPAASEALILRAASERDRPAWRLAAQDTQAAG